MEIKDKKSLLDRYKDFLLEGDEVVNWDLDPLSSIKRFMRVCRYGQRC